MRCIKQKRSRDIAEDVYADGIISPLELRKFIISLKKGSLGALYDEKRPEYSFRKGEKKTTYTSSPPFHSTPAL